jgi:hypothetical protein
MISWIWRIWFFHASAGTSATRGFSAALSVKMICLHDGASGHDGSHDAGVRESLLCILYVLYSAFTMLVDARRRSSMLITDHPQLLHCNHNDQWALTPSKERDAMR